MDFVNPNKIERLGREAGLRSEDIWSDWDDTETLEQITHPIQEALPNIEARISEHELTSETRHNLETVRSFCAELSEEFRQAFLLLLEQYRRERCLISQKIVDYLLKKNLVLPTFVIANGERAHGVLNEYKLNGDVTAHSLLVAFQLPKPLSQFWWKGGADSWGSGSEHLGSAVIEWGHFYRELMRVVWETQGYYENEYSLRFERINSVGEHDPKKYYYVWEVSEWAVTPHIEALETPSDL